MSLISVILPFRNAETTISAAVYSILGQTTGELELLLINDNSTDQSKAKIEIIDDKRIRLLDNDQTGLVSALNLGVQKANGHFIARMDADDISHPQRFATQLQHLSGLPNNYVSSCRVNYLRADIKNGNTKGYQLHVDWLNNIITAEQHYLNRFIDAPLAHPTLFCRRETFLEYGSYKEGEHPEDFELWLRWMAQGVRIEKLTTVLYDWYDYPQRLSREHINYRQSNFSKVKASYFAQWWSKNCVQELWIIGYGKEVFSRSQHLVQNGLKITGYVDLQARPQAKRRVVSYEEVRPSNDRFYLVYVSDREGKKHIKHFFNEQCMTNGEHYLFMA